MLQCVIECSQLVAWSMIASKCHLGVLRSSAAVGSLIDNVQYNQLVFIVNA